MIRANENYNSILIRYCFYKNTWIVLISIFCFAFVLEMLIVLVCFQHLLFQFTIYDFDSFWFMSQSLVKYLSSTLFLNEQARGKKGADLMLSFSLPQCSTSITDRLSLFFVHAITVMLMSSSILLFHLTHALSYSRDRFLFARLHKKQWNIFTHEKRRKTEKKSRIVAYKNEIEGEEKSGQ